MSVKVAVRVRPFNAREVELGCSLCVEMNGKTTSLLDAEKKRRDFTFDYSFWSHDGFSTTETGLMVPTTDKYADQRKVYETLGLEVLQNAWDGYHCCLFAYGQTGAGKSYSMLGYGANKGIVPISTEEIFTRISKNSDSKKSYEVLFSMLEIYNEKIQDLLIAVNERPNAGLKVRENKTLGVYVEGLSKWPVKSYSEIETKMELGNKHRSVASTMMNSTSSRAHTIITIEFKQIMQEEKRKSEKLSVINLVDLAGSEKIGKTGTSGDRLKEGCSINLSLTVLGVVISKLADLSTGKTKNVVVPYRDSALTRILQNALGGNSKTLMICAISPATDNYEETLSTLRYADQAKKIKNNAVVNESETDKMIRELKQENDKLKHFLEEFAKTNGKLPPQIMEQFGLAPNMNGNQAEEETENEIKSPEVKKLNRKHSVEIEEAEYKKKVEELESQLNSNLALVNEYQRSFEERMLEMNLKEIKEEPKEDYSVPHLINLNEDPLLNGKIYFNLCEKKIVRVGKKDGDPKPDVILAAIGIRSNHAIISNVDGRIWLEPCAKECGNFISLNGDKVFDKAELYHMDRILFGTSTVLVLKYPERKFQQRDKNLDENELDWEFAQKEIALRTEKFKKLEEKETEIRLEMERQKKIEQIEKEYSVQKEQTEASLREEFEKKLQEIQKENEAQQQKELLQLELEKDFTEVLQKYEAEKVQKELELERRKKEIMEEAIVSKYKETEKHFFEDKLVSFLPQITEVNLMAKELKRNCHFSIKLVYTYSESYELQHFGEHHHKTKLQIKVVNKDYNCVFFWSLKTFTNRYFMIKELLDSYFETNIIPILPVDQDPFWDPPSPHILGQGLVKLMSLCYYLDNPCEIVLVGDQGQVGMLKVNIIPCEENGTYIDPDQVEFIEDPRSIIGQNLHFFIEISSGNLHSQSCKNTYCEYSMINSNNERETFRTSVIHGIHEKPFFDYKQKHSYIDLNENIFNYLLNHNLCIKVFGFDNDANLEIPTEPMPMIPVAKPQAPATIISTETPSKPLGAQNNLSRSSISQTSSNLQNTTLSNSAIPNSSLSNSSLPNSVPTKSSINKPQIDAKQAKTDLNQDRPKRSNTVQYENKNQNQKQKKEKENCNIF